MNTIIEKIRAEIERRMRICERVRGEGGENQDYYHGKAVSYNETLTFLSDLEKECEDFPTTDEEMAKFLATHPKVEVPEKYKTPDWMFEKSEKPSEGLEEEVDKYLEEHFDYNSEYNSIRLKGDYFPSPQTLKDIASHFAQWGAEHRGSSEVPIDLEEAAGEYEKKHTYQRYDGGGLTPEYDATLAEAVIFGAKWQKEQMMKEAVEGAVSAKFGTISIPHNIYEKYDGQKVKIIIVKED